MRFHKDGTYFCPSSGPYDCLCKRCDFRYEYTERGYKALESSQKNDPRRKKVRMTDQELEGVKQVHPIFLETSALAYGKKNRTYK